MASQDMHTLAVTVAVAVRDWHTREVAAYPSLPIAPVQDFIDYAYRFEVTA